MFARYVTTVVAYISAEDPAPSRCHHVFGRNPCPNVARDSRFLARAFSKVLHPLCASASARQNNSHYDDSLRKSRDPRIGRERGEKLTLLCLVRLAPIGRRFRVVAPTATLRPGTPSAAGHPRSKGAEGLTPLAPAPQLGCTRVATLLLLAGPSTGPFITSRAEPPLHDSSPPTLLLLGR